MGQIYRLSDDNDELLSEAEKTFDLSARRQSILRNIRNTPEIPQRNPILKALAGLFETDFGSART